MTRKQDAAEAALHDQTNLLPKKQLIFVFIIMSLALLVAFIDQNSVGVLQPEIARSLHAESSISWTGTSALIANTTFQVLYGRLSDLFGRKNILLSALLLLSLSDLACGLAVNSTMLYIFRGLAGVAGGGITSVTMMIVSDIVTLQERGKYQGILGIQVGLGNALGPLLASAFAVNVSWRGIFYLLAPLIMVVLIACWKFLPSSMPKFDLKDTLAKIDFLGLVLGTAAVILLLIPTSEGGHAGVPWDSPKIIAMFSVGGACLIAFLIVEWKWAKLPMMPLSMFRKPSVAAMLTQTFLLGTCYYTYLFFLTLYLQNVRGKSPLQAALLQLPLSVTLSIFSTSAGYYQSRFNRYAELFYCGFGTWTIGAGLLTTCDETTPLGLFCFYLIIIGAGAGCVFQPSLVALQAHCPKAQRAVVTSNRNFLRSSGAAVGLAVSSAILANVLKEQLPPQLASVAKSTFSRPDLSLYTPAERAIIVHAYTAASRAVFIWCVPLIGIAFLLCPLIKDRGLTRKEEAEPEKKAVSGDDAATDVEKGESAEPQSEEHSSESSTTPETSNRTTDKAVVRSSSSSLKSEKSTKSTTSDTNLET